MQSEGPFCQSCSMPLNQSDLVGTEVDGSKSKKYCIYCYKDGVFVMPNFILEEMIEISAKGWSDQDSNLSYEQAKDRLNQILPYLERWRK